MTTLFLFTTVLFYFMSKVFIISGHSGSGKTTIAYALLKKMSNLKKVVTCTTRSPRVGEENGKDYHFLTKSEFEENIKNNLMAENEQYSGNYYGSRKEDVNKLLSSGNNVLFIVETKGALNLKKVFNDAILIFIKAPSVEELEKRLINRGDKIEDVKKRIDEVNDEIGREKEFDYIIVNDILENAIKEVEEIILKNSN